MVKRALEEPLAGGGEVSVQLVALDAFFASALSMTLDVLSTANLLGASLGGGRAPRFTWSVRTVGGGPVRSSSGLTVTSDGEVHAEPHDVLFVLGPGMADAGRVLADVARPDTRALLPVLQRAREHTLLAASCSSTFVLAEAGLLDGGEATTSWWLAPLFRSRYRDVALRPDAIVCASRSAMTAGAAMAQLDLSLAVVRRFAGAEIAHACAQYLVIDEARTSQAPFLVLNHLSRHDALVARAERWMTEHLAEPIELADVARALAVSERTLARHFVSSTGLSPVRFARRLRVEAAARLLAQTDTPIAEVGRAVGYDDERAFRRAFQSQMKRSPGAHRRAHRQSAR